jgi:antitoxin (DNA-binding transcriptional repressor) of toxin-antitoxin stability system
MKFITVRELRTSGGKITKALKDSHELVLTSNGTPIAIITPTNGDDLEEQLKAQRRARALIALDNVHRMSREAGTDKMTMKEIDAVIKQVRSERRKERENALKTGKR